MQIIKEYCKAAKKCVIRTSTYCHTFAFFKELVAEAKKDVPEVDEDGIEVVQFSGRYYARTYGIEFNCDTKPEDYTDIHQLEHTF